MQFNYGFATDVGLKRQKNQDSGAAYPDLGLYIIADGMGGHKGGEIASAMAVDIIPEVVRASPTPSARELLDRALTSANQSIFDYAQKDPTFQGMGTTTTALYFHDQALSIGHVGDSRCYYLRSNAIWQITRDHSLVQEKLRAGLISREELRTDRMKNVITRSVGFEPHVLVDVYEMAVYEGDVFLACSDGLSGLIEEAQILEIVRKEFYEGGDIQKTVDSLVKAANDRGGDDNITVLMVQVLTADH